MTEKNVTKLEDHLTELNAEAEIEEEVEAIRKVWEAVEDLTADQMKRVMQYIVSRKSSQK
jgi:hypothetical protein